MRYNDPTGHRSCGQGACYEGGGQLGGTGGPGAGSAGSAGQAALDVGVVIVYVTQAGARVTDAVGEFVTAITSGAGAAAPDGASVGGAGELAGATGAEEPDAFVKGKQKHKEAEKAYLDSVPADQRAAVDLDKTRIDPRTGKRFRPDAVNHETGDVVEYKPDTYQDGGSLQREAEQQAAEYAEHLNYIYGDQRALDGAPPYQGRVEYYLK
jgi:hypothetical protein